MSTEKRIYITFLHNEEGVISLSVLNTYLTKLEIEPIVKEIKSKDIEDFYWIKEQLYELKYQMNIYEVIEEN